MTMIFQKWLEEMLTSCAQTHVFSAEKTEVQFPIGTDDISRNYYIAPKALIREEFILKCAGTDRIGNCKLLINHQINTLLSTNRGKEQIVDNELY